MKTPILLSFLAIGLLSVPVQAATITLENGDRISGDIQARTLMDVTLTTSFGELTIPKSQIADIKADQVSTLKYDDMDPASMEAVAPAAGAAGGEPVVNVSSDGPQNLHGYLNADWEGEVAVSGVIEDGNTQEKSLGIALETEARRTDDRFGINIEFDQTRSEGRTTEDERELDLFYDYFFKPKWFSNTYLELEQDNVANVDLEMVIGQGIGYQPYESETLNLRYSAGLEYISEDYTTGNKEEYMAAAWNLDYDQKIFKDTITVFHNHDLSLGLEDTEDFEAETETGLKVPFSASLFGKAAVEFDYMNQPAAGAKSEDTTYSVSVGYSW